MSVSLDRLHALYADTDDPWNFNRSAYEQGKFAATRDALSRPSYRAALELGCGNGALAAYLSPACDEYTGIDAVEKAVEAARRRVPGARFMCNYYPCPLPPDQFDLIVLSEVLYFLSPDVIGRLVCDIINTGLQAEVICTTFLGDTEHLLQGTEALDVLTAAMKDRWTFACLANTGTYRIDRGLPTVPA